MSPKDSRNDPAMSRPIDLAIIGGGVSGVALLLGILKHTEASQVRPHIYEADPVLKEIGAGLSFFPNALSAMRLLDLRVIEAYWKLARPPSNTETAPSKQMTMHFATGCDGRDGKEFKAFDTISRVEVRKTGGGPGLHRAVYLDMLVNLIPKDETDTRQQGPYMTFSKRLVNITEREGNTGVTLYFADGTSTQADAVVGCDGIKGVTRKVLLTSNGEPEAIPPVFSGGYAYRGLVPLFDGAAGQSLPSELKDHINLQYGYGGSIMSYPIKDGQFLNVMATRQVPDQKWDSEAWVVPAVKADIERDFVGFGWAVQGIIARTEKLDKWALFEAQPCKRFYRNGTICILGDAAHATTPHQGAGAGICVEDAYVLSRLLAQLKNGDGEEMQRIFAVYDSVRRPRTLEVVKTSRENGLILAYMFSQTGDDLERIREHNKHRFDWIWLLDVEKHADEAVEIFRDGGTKQA